MQKNTKIIHNSDCIDPTLQFCEYGCTLIIGRSGSGKTFYVKKILEKLKKQKNKIYTINVQNNDYNNIVKSKIISIDFATINEIKPNSYVIVEDIISLSTKQNTQLRYLLNYSCHHKCLKIFVITHSIYKNGVYSLLSFFNYIVFTGLKSNLPILRFTLNYFKLEKEELTKIIKQFEMLALQNQHNYFVFDTKMLSFNLEAKNTYQNVIEELPNKVDSSANASITDFQERFEKFINDFDEKVKANAIFSIIINCLPLKLLRLHDLTFSFISIKSSKHIRISLVDYISCLLSEIEKITPEIFCLHRYLKQSCCIPRIFIKNKQLK